MFRVLQITVFDKKTQKLLCKPRRNREVQDIEAYKQREHKRYERLLETEVEIDVVFQEIPERRDQ